jgi:hypothetical protein
LKLANYNKNVTAFINIRESNVSMFNLVFEADETNLNMTNSSMLTFYLAKVFRIPKEKFRVLNTENFYAEYTESTSVLDTDKKVNGFTPLQKHHDPVSLVKVSVELIEDLPNI